LFKNRAFKVVNNGNELDTFLFNQLNRDRIRNDLRIDKKLVIGHIGSFNDQKNHEFIIELFKEYHKRNNASSLLLVGIGKNELLIKQKVKELGLTTHVHFLGKILDVHNLYSAMDIFILPSKFEGFPNVVIEAQISGLDIILSQNITSEVNICGNLKYLSIDDGVGSWIKEFLTTKFNNRIERSINNSKILKENGYDIRENAKHLETKYLEILNR
jgi:glycosyltransferase involved in cell wall biosynthesis